MSIHSIRETIICEDMKMLWKNSFNGNEVNDEWILTKRKCKKPYLGTVASSYAKLSSTTRLTTTRYVQTRDLRLSFFKDFRCQDNCHQDLPYKTINTQTNKQQVRFSFNTVFNAITYLYYDYSNPYCYIIHKEGDIVLHCARAQKKRRVMSLTHKTFLYFTNAKVSTCYLSDSSQVNKLAWNLFLFDVELVSSLCKSIANEKVPTCSVS